MDWHKGTVVDLTLPVYQDMPVYPNDPAVRFVSATEFGSDGFAVHDIGFGTHTGTHVDAPRHYIRDGVAVDDATVLNAAVGRAMVIDVADKLVDNMIIPESLEPALALIGEGGRILIATNWSKRFGEPDYYHGFPTLSEELAHILVERRIALLGTDTPSLHPEKDDTIHRLLLSNGIVIVENLFGLGRLAGRRIFFSAAPLKLMGLDGSPSRAYAIVDDE